MSMINDNTYLIGLPDLKPLQHFVDARYSPKHPLNSQRIAPPLLK